MKKIIGQLLTLQNFELETPKAHVEEALDLRKQIPADVLAYFDRFLGRSKTAVARVQNGVCKGCQMSMPVGVVNALILGVGPSTCGNCGRYLYLLEEDAASFRDRDKSPARVVTMAVPGQEGEVKPRRKAIRAVRKMPAPM